MQREDGAPTIASAVDGNIGDRPQQATGQPADGYVVKGEPDVDPKTITVSGPLSAIEVLQFARLSAFDGAGLSEGVHKRRLGIDSPPVRVRYLGPQAATVAVSIARRVSEVRFENRPVEVAGVPGGVAAPRTVDLPCGGTFKLD